MNGYVLYRPLVCTGCFIKITANFGEISIYILNNIGLSTKSLLHSLLESCFLVCGLSCLDNIGLL